MDPESKKLLEETLQISKENNVILHKLRRSMQIRRVLSVVYWTVIIGSAIGAYYFIEPYVDRASEFYGGAQSNFESLNEFLKNLKPR